MRNKEVIGLIPCGGYGNRIAPLPCSKEILPVGLRYACDGSLRPKVVSHYLLDKMQTAGVRRAFFILRSGKWDIPEYYGGGDTIGMDLAYLILRRSLGPPYTVDEAYPFVRGARVAFGFPDILFGPGDALVRALARLTATRSDLVLGLYRPGENLSLDMADVDRAGRVRELVVIPNESKLKLGWIFAVWKSTFTEFLHKYLAGLKKPTKKSDDILPEELTMGHAIQAAIKNGFHAQSVSFGRSSYLDIGTGEGLQRLMTKWPLMGRSSYFHA